MSGFNPLAGITVSRLVSPLKTFVSPRDLATKARALMREYRVRVLPVLEGGRLEGVVTQRDILRVTSTRSNIPVAGVMGSLRTMITPATELSKAVLSMVEQGLDEIPVVQSYTDRVAVGILRVEDVMRLLLDSLSSPPKVASVMTREVAYCHPEDELSQVWELMEREQLSGLPVVEEWRGKMRVVGVVTRTDIIQSGSVRTAEESKKGRTPAKVKSIMRTPAITISPNATVVEAVELMLSKKVKRLPVVDGEVLVGIVSRSDILKFVCGGRA